VRRDVQFVIVPGFFVMQTVCCIYLWRS